MAFNTPIFGTSTGFGSFNKQPASTPAFNWPSTTTASTPATSSTPASSWSTTPIFPPAPTTAPATTATATASDKGQLLACLTESKGVQMAILHELQTMNSKLGNSGPTPAQQASIIFAPPKPIHTGVFCNVCNKSNIAGARYKCLFCKDYDLCEECEARSATVHDPSHVFIKIKDTPGFLAKMATQPSCFAS